MDSGLRVAEITGLLMLIPLFAKERDE